MAGDAQVYASQMNVTDDANIGGSLSYRTENPSSVPSSVAESVVIIPPAEPSAEEAAPPPTLAEQLLWWTIRVARAFPITTLWGGAHLLAMMGAGYGIPAGWAGVKDFDAAENRWRYAPATDEYRELHRFLRRAYAAGILDPEYFTQSDEEFTNKMTDGRALATVTWITSGFKNWDDKLHENGIPDGQWAPLPVPESTIGLKALPPVDPFRKGLIVPSSVVHEPDFERLLKFLDWAIYSDAGIALTLSLIHISEPTRPY